MSLALTPKSWSANPVALHKPDRATWSTPRTRAQYVNTCDVLVIEVCAVSPSSYKNVSKVPGLFSIVAATTTTLLLTLHQARLDPFRSPQVHHTVRLAVIWQASKLTTSATMTSLLPAASSSFYPNTALVIGLFPTLVGAAIILHPPLFLSVFDFPPPSPSTPQADKLITSLSILFGVRDLVIGLSTLAVWKYGNRRSLGCVILAGVGIVLGDGLVNRWQVGHGEWKHWVFIPLSTVVGGKLIGWF